MKSHEIVMQSSISVPDNSAVPEVQPLTATSRVVFLDALRFIAAAAVLFQHAVEREGELGAQIAGLLSPGVFGVVLFFIVSGFVIPMTAVRRFDLRKFALRRLFRIYPLVIATFLILAVLGYGTDLPQFAFVKSASWRDWVANLLLVQDYVGATSLWGVTWTLSLEAVWYALFALSILYLGRNFDDRLAVAAPIILLVLVGVSLILGHRLPLGRIGMIYAAVLGCRVYRNFTGEVTFRRLLVDAGIFVLVTLISNIVSFGYYKHPNITMFQAVIPWVLAPILFVLVAGVRKIRQSKIVNNHVIGELGAISFSTYMLHPFAISFAERFVPAELTLVAALALTLVFSIAGYWLVEVPGQALGRRISAR